MLRTVDKLDKIGPDKVAALLVESGLTDAQAKASLQLAEIATTDASFVDQVRALGVQHETLDEGLEQLAAIMTAANEHAPGLLTRRPADRARPGLLHRHRLRDPAGRARVVRLDLLRWPVRRARQRRQDVVPGGRASRSGCPGCSPGCSARGWSPRPGRRRPPYWWRWPTRKRGPRRCGPRQRCGRAGSLPRWRRRRPSSASRSGSPTGAASRTCGSPATPDSEVKDIRSGDQVDADSEHLDAPHRGPAAAGRCYEQGELRDPYPHRRLAAGRAHRRDRHAGGLGGAAARSRRSGVHRPARLLRRGPGGDPGRGGRAPAARRVLPEGHRRGVDAAGGQRRTRASPTGEIEVVAADVEVLSAAAPLPFPVEEHHTTPVNEEVRLKHRYLDLRRSGPGLGAAAAQRGEPDRPRRAGRARLRRDRDPDADPVDPGGRPRLPGPGPAAARLVVRAAAVAAAVQAAADGGRDGAVLPDRALLPRRGLPRRPAAGVHPARHRDELRRPGRHHRAVRGGAGGALEARRARDHDADPADDVRRGDAAVRHRQAGSADGPGAGGVHRVLRGHAVPGVPGRLRRGRRDARWCGPAAQAAGRLAGLGQAARSPRAGVRAGRCGRRAGRTGREEPVRGRARRPGRARRCLAWRLHLLRRGPAEAVPGTARCRAAGDRPRGRG